MPAKGQVQDIVTRFESKIRKNGLNKCWIWTSASTGRYGIFWAGIRRTPYSTKRNELAHRFSFRLYKGKIPKGKQVLHHCDNGHCVNPKHLYVGTHQDNMDDKVKRNRTPDQYGEKNPCCTTSIAQVRHLRKLAKQTPKLLHRQIGEIVGLNRRQVGRILEGSRWANTS